MKSFDGMGLGDILSGNGVVVDEFVDDRLIICILVASLCLFNRNLFNFLWRKDLNDEIGGLDDDSRLTSWPFTKYLLEFGLIIVALNEANKKRPIRNAKNSFNSWNLYPSLRFDMYISIKLI